MIRLLSVLFVSVSVFFTIGSARAQNYWAPAGLQGDSVTSIAVDGNGNLFAGVAYFDNEYPIPYIGVFQSSNSGGTWTMLPNQGSNVLGPVYGCVNGYVYIAGGKGIYRLKEADNTIIQIRLTPQADGDPQILSVALTPMGAIYVVAGDGNIYYSSDNGNDFTADQIAAFTDIDNSPSCIACSPQGILYCASSTQICSQASPTKPWTLIGRSFGGFGSGISFAFDASGNIAAGGINGLYRSTDNGGSWQPIASANAYSSYAVAMTGSDDIVYSPYDENGDESGVYLSTNNGTNWNEVNGGLTNTFVNAFTINNPGYVFAATYGGVFMSTASTGALNDVKEIASDIPPSITLEQSYPNPVTSSATVRFGIPEAGMVTINVYDVTGKQVAEIANGFYSPGTYDASLDGAKLPSGMYIYRMEANGQSLSRSFMILP